MIAEIRRNSNYPAAEWRALQASEPIDPADTLSRLRRALDEAQAFALRMPTFKMGLLFLERGAVVEPDPDHLDAYEAHAGRRRGHWPGNAEVTAAMLARVYAKRAAEKSDEGD